MGKPIEIAVISGKGGTGKTVFAASLAKVTLGSVVADCDVETPNLHLLLGPHIGNRHDFPGDKTAVLDATLCTSCGECHRVCRFGAVREIDAPDGWAYSVDARSCEGCAVCTVVCPTDALALTQAAAGAWYVSSWDFGPFVHADLTSAQKNSDALIRILRREAKEIAARQHYKYIIVDGPAGIGAPVIAAIEGASLVVVVTEPTVSGMQDLRRVLQLVQQLGIRAAAVINKHDLNSDVTLAIEEYLAINGFPLLGRICFSPELNRAVGQGEIIVDDTNESVAQTIRSISDRTLAFAAGENGI
jgi:MinD superfamily P-loop ATPase